MSNKHEEIMTADGFTVVSNNNYNTSRRQKRKGHRILHGAHLQGGSVGKHSPGFIYTDSSDAADVDKKLLTNVIFKVDKYKTQIQSTEYLTRLVDLLRTEFIAKTPGSVAVLPEHVLLEASSSSYVQPKPTSEHFTFDIVCYGLGDVIESSIAQCQLALLLLLQERCGCEKVYVYDPRLDTDNGKAIIQHFKLSWIFTNEECKRRVYRRTLFYMPHCTKLMYSNTIGANWVSRKDIRSDAGGDAGSAESERLPTAESSRSKTESDSLSLPLIAILGNSFASYYYRLTAAEFKRTAFYMSKVFPQYVKEITLEEADLAQVHQNCFNDLSLHLFPKESLPSVENENFWMEAPVAAESDDVDLELVLNLDKLKLS